MKKETVGVEIERKFIIKKPYLPELSKREGYTKSEILQIYLPAPKGETHRIRSRSYGKSTVYIETKKRRIDPMSVIETEREIDEAEFTALSQNIKRGTRPIHKFRHTFPYKDHVFEIDIYPEWRDTCIMEVELEKRDTPVDLPPFIKIIKEVTGGKNYSNAAMSRSFPREESESQT